jgi:hypothetical protein
MSEWEKDIKDWVRKWFKTNDPKQIARTRAIAEQKWDPNYDPSIQKDPDGYDSSMRKDLHHWLDNWYTLSVKDMPKPATLRKNPINDPLHLLYKQILEGSK